LGSFFKAFLKRGKNRKDGVKNASAEWLKAIFGVGGIKPLSVVSFNESIRKNQPQKKGSEDYGVNKKNEKR